MGCCLAVMAGGPGGAGRQAWAAGWVWGVGVKLPFGAWGQSPGIVGVVMQMRLKQQGLPETTGQILGTVPPTHPPTGRGDKGLRGRTGGPHTSPQRDRELDPECQPRVLAASPAPREGLTGRLRPPAPVWVSLYPCVQAHACSCADHVSVCEAPRSQGGVASAGPLPSHGALAAAPGGRGQPPTDLDHGVQPWQGPLRGVPAARLAGGGAHGAWSAGPRGSLGPRSGVSS